ncbi:MAG: hypothetical protein BWY26_00107 [Elusimicrobia bacterium ADurb.Bin231]|nr:MAG: hypothetical protein BWY26_00107 [Elusimicrobia bacterium ADurb.Bin231]
MSTCQIYDVECRCHAEFQAKLWDSINVTKNPELKEKLLNGEVNVVICPVCGLMFYVEKFVLYHDEKKKFMFYVYTRDCPETRDDLLSKALKDYATLTAKSECDFLSNYNFNVFKGMDELVFFIKQNEELL